MAFEATNKEMADRNPQLEIQWQSTFQGRTSYAANCQRDILIIVSSESLQGDDIVPRQMFELTQEDLEKLKKLNLPNPIEQWKDDASIMVARYELDREDYSSITVMRKGTKQSVLRACELLMKSTTKAGITLHYIGPGKKDTGDWCFEDGFITFRELAELYTKHFTSKLMVITADCSYSGGWVKACIRFLDEQGVQPCGHSARKKGILVKVRTSSKSNEIPHRLFNSIRTYTNDKNNGALGTRQNGWEVAKEQHLSLVDSTTLQCAAKSVEAYCTLSFDYTWQRRQQEERVYLVRGKDKGRPAWHYVLLVDDDETIKNFKEKVASGTLDVAHYGQVLKSGWGKDPPNEVRDWIDKEYSTTYT